MDNQNNTTSVFHSLSSNSGSFVTRKVLVLFLIVIAVGLSAGYFLALQSGHSMTSSTAGSSSVQKGTAYGSTDTATFKDTTEGTVQQGGIAGEGQFHLVRPGGDSQNVYMTSSLVDLSQFVGKKVKVWGQTQTAKKAGWLMDVGRVEVLQ